MKKRLIDHLMIEKLEILMVLGFSLFIAGKIDISEVETFFLINAIASPILLDIILELKYSKYSPPAVNSEMTPEYKAFIRFKFLKKMIKLEGKEALRIHYTHLDRVVRDFAILGLCLTQFFVSLVIFLSKEIIKNYSPIVNSLLEIKKFLIEPPLSMAGLVIFLVAAGIIISKSFRAKTE